MSGNCREFDAQAASAFSQGGPDRRIPTRQARRAAGLCCRCDAPRFRGGRCEAHYAAVLAENRERARRKPKARPRVGRKPGDRTRYHEAPPLQLRGWHVYTLHDPQTDATRYVGLTEWPRRRWLTHLGAARLALAGRRDPTPVMEWFGSLLVQGLRPVMRLVCPVNGEEDGRDVEAQTIRRLAAEGHNILNVQGLHEKGPAICGRCHQEGHSWTTCHLPKPTVAENCKVRHERLRAEGRCIWCAEPAEGGRSRCSSCIEKGRASAEERRREAQARKIAEGGTTYACRACGEKGHNRRTCARKAAA